MPMTNHRPSQEALVDGTKGLLFKVQLSYIRHSQMPILQRRHQSHGAASGGDISLKGLVVILSSKEPATDLPLKYSLAG